MKAPTLRTERLLLRRWTDEDRDVFAHISADPEVMRYRLAPLSQHESDALIDETEASFDKNGFGLWAVERIEDGRLLGFTGFGTSDFDAAFCPAVDIGWTLARDMWGHGYATEGALAALDFAFDHLQLDEVVAHTTRANERSRAVMRRLGMTHDPGDDFDGPWYPPGHPRRRFVLYRLKVTDWGGQASPCDRCGPIPDGTTPKSLIEPCSITATLPDRRHPVDMRPGRTLRDMEVDNPLRRTAPGL